MALLHIFILWRAYIRNHFCVSILMGLYTGGVGYGLNSGGLISGVLLRVSKNNRMFGTKHSKKIKFGLNYIKQTRYI